MISIFITFFNDRLKIIRKNNQVLNEIKFFKEDESFTTVRKNSLKVEFLPNERPYTKANIPFTSLSIYKGEIVSFLHDALDEISKVILKEKFNEIYIITDNNPYVIKEFRELTNEKMKQLYGNKYMGCFYIPFIIKAILKTLAKLKMKDYLIIGENMIVSSSFYDKKDLVADLYLDPIVPKNKGVIEEIYHKTAFSYIYDTIPYEIIAGVIVGGIKRYLDGYRGDLSFKTQDRNIIIKEEDIIDSYNELILDNIKTVLKEINKDNLVVLYLTDSKAYIKDLSNIIDRNCRMAFPMELLFSYVEFLGLLNEDLFIKSARITKNIDVLYEPLQSMGRNTAKFEKKYKELFKDYKKYF